MRTPVFHLTVFLLTLLMAHAAQALSVNAVRFGTHPDKTRMVLELSNSTDFRVFTLPDPYRIVVDMPDFDWNAGNIVKPKAGAIKAVRSGHLQPGISRMVIDLEQPAAIRSAFLLPAASGKPDRLVVDFAPVSPREFLARKDRIHGTLQTGAPRLNLPSPEQQNARTAAIETPGSAIPPRKPVPYAQKPLIVIDAGHGGQDPGAVGAGNAYEKHVTLAAAQELKKQLEATGLYRVRLTRDNDRFIKLHNRIQIARTANADLFISLHADSIDKPNVRGASIYTLSNKASDAQTAKLAARENRADLIAGVDLSHEDQDVANILIDLAMRDTMNQSKFLANTLTSNMESRGVRLLERPHRYAGFAVLKAPDIPSVLVEMGFMSNSQEARALSSAPYRSKIAAALVDGINVYFTKVRKNDNS